MIAAFLAVLASGAVCPDHLCDAERLRPYFAKLAEARGGRRTVRVIQIGDSHTAGDQITGAWRTALQARYGSAGRGVLAPGRPYQGYLTRGITAAQSPGWVVDGIFGAAWHDGAGASRGLSHYSLSTRTEGASLSLAADAGKAFDRFTVCAIHTPGAGVLTLTAGTASATVPLGDAGGPRCTTLHTDAPVFAAALSVTGGPVTITSWATERDAGGVALSNLGTVGIQMTHLARVDDAVLGTELREYRPDLLVVAFGTNEAFSPSLTPAGFENAFRVQVARLRRFAPGVPMLLLGAPDSATRRADLRAGYEGCDIGPRPAPSLAPIGADQPLLALIPSDWSPTANLLTVQSLQRRLAHELGLAYWDWSAAMGGRCTASVWAALDPPLMRPDHVHFTSAGGREIARRLQRDLDAAARTLGAADGEPAE